MAETAVDPVDFLVQPVDLFLNTIEPCFDRSEVVAVPPGLFKDVAGNELLALDLLFERLKFLSGHVRRHRVIP
jgi:hypothetical protein